MRGGGVSIIIIFIEPKTDYKTGEFVGSVLWVLYEKQLFLAENRVQAQGTWTGWKTAEEKQCLHHLHHLLCAQVVHDDVQLSL